MTTLLLDKVYPKSARSVHHTTALCSGRRQNMKIESLIFWSTDFYNREAGLLQAVNHKRVGAGAAKVPGDPQGHFLGGVFFSGREEVDKRRTIAEQGLPQLRRHPIFCLEDSVVQKSRPN